MTDHPTPDELEALHLAASKEAVVAGPNWSRMFDLLPALAARLRALVERVEYLEDRLVNEHMGSPGREEARRWEARAHEKEMESAALREERDALAKRVDRVWDLGIEVQGEKLLAPFDSSDDSQRERADKVAEHIQAMSDRSLRLAEVEKALESVLGKPGVPIIHVANPSVKAERDYSRGYNQCLQKIRERLAAQEGGDSE